MKKYYFNQIRCFEDESFYFCLNVPADKIVLTDEFGLLFKTGKLIVKGEKYSFVKVNSFKAFLLCLKHTYVNNNYNYVITDLIDDKTINFDELLKAFVNKAYKSKKPDAAKIKQFYKDAYAIQQEAMHDKRLLLSEPREII